MLTFLDDVQAAILLEGIGNILLEDKAFRWLMFM
jgi:hypothetical protein